MDREKMAEEVAKMVEENILPGLRTFVAAGVDSVSATLAYSEAAPDRDLTPDEKEVVRKSTWETIESRVTEIAHE